MKQGRCREPFATGDFRLKAISPVAKGSRHHSLGRVVRTVKLAVRKPDDFPQPVYAVAREIAVKTSPFPGQSGLSAVPAGE